MNDSYNQGDTAGAEYGLTVVDDPQFRGVTTDRLKPLLSSQYYLFIVDDRTIRETEHPLLAVDNNPDRPPSADYPTFRLVPRVVASVEINLTLANADFEDYSTRVGDDGIYR